MTEHVKIASSDRAARWEASGLDWLRAANGVPVVDVLGVDQHRLILRRLATTGPTAAAAETFGRQLAQTHAASASAFGAGPPDWAGEGYQGPADDLLPLTLAPFDSWGRMYADARLVPLLQHLPQLGADAEPLLERLRGGEWDGTCARPARLHGDLWSGNVMWTPDGVVLIDPAPYGGHAECDLAALALFGTPRLETILAAYDEVAPLADGWRDRVPLMQLHMVAMHAVLFGGGYVGQTQAILTHYA